MTTTLVEVRKLKELSAPARKTVDLAIYQFFSLFEGGTSEIESKIDDFIKLQKEAGVWSDDDPDELLLFRKHIIALIEALEICFVSNDIDSLVQYINIEDYNEKLMMDNARIMAERFNKTFGTPSTIRNS